MSDQTEVKESPFLDTVINCVLEVEKKEPKQ